MSSSAGVAVQTTPAQKLIDARRTAVKLFHTIEQQGAHIEYYILHIKYYLPWIRVDG